MGLCKKQYQADPKTVGSEEIKQVAKKRRGRPLTLGNLDEKVQQYITAFRKAGTPVNARVVLAATEGIVKATDRTLLFENGGLKLSLNWAYSLLRRVGYGKRKATTKARTALSGEQFCCCQETLPSADQESSQRWQNPPFVPSGPNCDKVGADWKKCCSFFPVDSSRERSYKS